MICLAPVPDDTLCGNWNKTWLIDGSIFPKPAGKGGFRLITPSAGEESEGIFGATELFK
jgi:hypothetical protein